MRTPVPDIAITEKVVRSVGQSAAIGNDSSLGGGLAGASVIIALTRKEGITMIREVRSTILFEDGHVSVIAPRPVPV